MGNIFKTVVEKIYDILPNSPFHEMYESVDMSFGDFIPYMNWFVPFDICFKIMSVWLGCIVSYYVFKLIWKIVFDVVIGKLIA